MKKIIAVLLVVVILIMATGCGAEKQNQPTTIEKTPVTYELDEKNGSLFVNDIDLTEKSYVYVDSDKKYAKLPLLDICEVLGADISKNGDNFNIVFTDEAYELVPSQNRLSIVNQRSNYIQDPDPIINPYAENVEDKRPVYYQQTEDDFLVDSSAIEQFLFLRNAELQIDYDEKTVKITSVKRQPAEIFVDGVNIKKGAFVRINHKERYAEIPLLSVLESLGADISVSKDGTKIIKYEDRELVLNERKHSLVFEDVNYFSGHLAGGPVYEYYKITDDELIVDTVSVAMLFYKLNLRVKIDYGNNIVYVDHRD